MDLEYLIVGIAKENPDDLAEFYKKTCNGAFALALAYTKDRFLAKEIVVEAYKRVKKYAYKFDTEMNAEYWVLDIIKNLSINALCDGELSAVASENHLENVSNLLRQAICETDEDRGKIIALRIATDLSKSEVARLLWYNGASCNGEFTRGIKQLVALEPDYRDFPGVTEALLEDIKKCTPEVLSDVNSENDTLVSRVSHKNYMIGDDEFALPGESKENRKQRVEAKKAESRKKKIITICIIAGVAVLIAAAALVWWFFENRDTRLEEPDDPVNVTEPQYNTRVALAEYNGVLYFQNLAEGGALYSLDLNNGDAKPVRICDHEPKELVIYKDVMYYRNDNDGKLYKRPVSAAAGTESTKLGVSGAVLEIVNDKIYYSSVSGISVMGLDGSDPTVILDVDGNVSFTREDIEVAEDGTVYFSSGHNQGFYRLVPQEDGSYAREDLLPTLNIYDFQLSGNVAYYDMQSLGAATGSVYAVRVTDKGYVENSKTNATLLSSAFVVKDKYIYYYGAESGEDGKAIKGIYRVDLHASEEEDTVWGAPELIVDLSGKKYDASYMYASRDRLYYYYSNGEKSSAKPYYMLEMYELSGEGYAENNVAKQIFCKG